MELLTSAEVAQLLNVSKRTVHRWADEGTLPLHTRNTAGLFFEKKKIGAILEKREAAKVVSS